MNKILIILVLVLTMGVLFPNTVAAADNRLYFSPDTITLNTGEQQDVKLHMNPNGTSIIGVDMVFVFDPSIITITDIKSLNVFSNTTGKNISNTEGIAKFSLSNSYGSYQTGEADIALITIQGKQSSSYTKLYLDYSPGKTTDTNLVTTRGQDILTSVGSLGITVNNSSQSPSSTPIPGPSSTPEPNPSPTGYIYSSPTPYPVRLSPTPYKNNDKDNNNNGQDNNKDKEKNQNQGNNNNNNDSKNKKKSIGNILGITDDSTDGTNTSSLNYLPLIAYALILGFLLIKGFQFTKKKIPLFQKKDIYLTLCLMITIMLPILMIPKQIHAQTPTDTPAPTLTSTPPDPTATTIPATPTSTPTPTNSPNPTATITPTPTQQPSASTVPTKIIKKSTVTPTRYPTLTPTVTPTPELTETPTPTPSKGSSIPVGILPIIFILGGILFIGGAVVINRKFKKH